MSMPTTRLPRWTRPRGDDTRPDAHLKDEASVPRKDAVNLASVFIAPLLTSARLVVERSNVIEFSHQKASCACIRPIRLT